MNGSCSPNTKLSVCQCIKMASVIPESKMGSSFHPGMKKPLLPVTVNGLGYAREARD